MPEVGHDDARLRKLYVTASPRSPSIAAASAAAMGVAMTAAVTVRTDVGG